MTDEPKLLIEEMLEAMSECPYWDNEAQALALARVMLGRMREWRGEVIHETGDTYPTQFGSALIDAFAHKHGLKEGGE